MLGGSGSSRRVDKREAALIGRSVTLSPRDPVLNRVLAYALRGPALKCFGTHGRPVVQGERYTWMQI